MNKANNTPAEILNIINQSKNVLLHFHPKPDLDSIGSALAMKEVLLGLGKKVTVISGDSVFPEENKILPGASDVLESNFFQIDLSDFDLFISLDSAHKTRISSLGEVVFPDNLTVVNIDHHSSNPYYGHFNFVDHHSPATCQVLYQLFKLWSVPINKNIATNLFVGIYSDTGGFKYRSTTEETFSIVSDLVSLVPDFADIIIKLHDSLEPGHLYYRGLVFDHIKLFGKNNVALIAISHQQLIDHGVDKKHTERQEISSELITVKDWDIGITAIEKEPGKISISMRSRNPKQFDVSLIARHIGLGGGGHKVAAGAFVLGDIDQAEREILGAIKTEYPELA